MAGKFEAEIDELDMHPSAPYENEKAVINKDYSFLLSMVAMQGIEPRTLRI
jgi:hypothetical protein